MRRKTKDRGVESKLGRVSTPERRSLLFNRQSLIVLMLACALALVSLLTLTPPVLAQEIPSDSDETCMLCHSEPDLTMVLPSNEVLPLTADPDILAHSAHGEAAETPLNCVDCHNDKNGYPHADLLAPNYRAWQLQMSAVCGNCHEDEALKRQDSIHARLLAGGRVEAATCIDCHGSHDVKWANSEKHEVDREAQVDACGQCHSTIADEFHESIHGQELAEGNPDVPTCTSCHPAHEISDPRSAVFRTESPDTCGKCHADEDLMAKYDISTDVFDTYVADFHGTTVQIFESTEPGVYTNKAVCSDCHSAHHILPPTDENSSVIQANLIRTCQRCHPDASQNFTASWMGHYRPSWQKFPLVMAVDWFYKLLIPSVLGFFILFIGLDASRTVYDRSKQRREYRRSKRKKADSADEGGSNEPSD